MAKSEEKRVVTEVVQSYIDPEMSFKDLRSTLDALEEAYPDHTNFYIRSNPGWYEEGFLVKADRPETSKEQEARKTKARRAKEARSKRRSNKEEKERKLLEELKKKYEE